MFFLLFLLSPFAFLGFYTVDYLYSCILHIPQHRIQFPFRLASYSHSGPLAFRPLRPAHSGATLQHPLPPPHLLRTCLAPFAHPYICQHRRCFCLFRARPAQCERINATHLDLLKCSLASPRLVRSLEDRAREVARLELTINQGVSDSPCSS